MLKSLTHNKTSHNKQSEKRIFFHSSCSVLQYIRTNLCSRILTGIDDAPHLIANVNFLPIIFPDIKPILNVNWSNYFAIVCCRAPIVRSLAKNWSPSSDKIKCVVLPESYRKKRPKRLLFPHKKVRWRHRPTMLRGGTMGVHFKLDHRRFHIRLLFGEFVWEEHRMFFCRSARWAEKREKQLELQPQKEYAPTNRFWRLQRMTVRKYFLFSSKVPTSTFFQPNS